MSKSIYTGSRDNQLNENKDNNEKSEFEDEGSKFTAFDLRIYDLEKDIKSLNENFEELTFQIDDLKKIYEELNLNFKTLLLKNQSKTDSSEIDEVASKDTNVLELEKDKENKNSLGSLVISTEDLSDTNDNNDLSTEELLETKVYSNPEDQFQIAFDLLRNQKFNQAKEALLVFIGEHEDNKLSGSAHYWLGEIYILKKEYKDAALSLAEGYQKYPDSIKAPDMLYKLSEALIKINKIDESCNILKKLSNEFPENLLATKANSKFDEIKCDEEIQ